MKIKEISPNKKNFLIRDLKKDYKNKKYKFYLNYGNYKEFEQAQLEHLRINKKNNLLDFQILEG